MKRSGLKESGLTKNSALVLMTAIVIVRGSSFLFSKQLLDSMQPLNLLGIRFLLAFLILFLVFFKRVAANIRRDPGILPASLLLGGTYFLVIAAELCGLKYTTS